MSETARTLSPEHRRIDTSHLITEDDEPLDSTFHERQQVILTDTLYASWKGPGAPARFVSLRNVGVFGNIRGKGIVPDVLVALNVDLVPCEESKSYFVWEYGKPPDLVIEIVSKEPGGEDDHKMESYAAIGVPYYVIYNPFEFRGERILKAYQRHGLGYLDVVQPQHLPELGLGLTIWQGCFQGCEASFLRFLDAQGNLLLTGDEQAAQERQRADQQQQRADQQQRRADQQQQRAEQEQERADRPAAKLRELGIDPT